MWEVAADIQTGEQYSSTGSMNALKHLATTATSRKSLIVFLKIPTLLEAEAAIALTCFSNDIFESRKTSKIFNSETISTTVPSTTKSGKEGSTVRDSSNYWLMHSSIHLQIRYLQKHPSAPENLSLPDPPDGFVVPAVASEMGKGILSFHAGTSGGPDGLRLGHLRSLVAHGSAEAGSRLLSALTDLVNVMLRDEVP